MLKNKKNTSLLIFFCFLTRKIASTTPVSYDQRQTGDVNVQIDLKDVQVVALVDGELLDDYMDYNYAYDYADFTIKPITKPTSSPASNGSSTVAPWSTWPTIAPSSNFSTTISKIEENISTLSLTENKNSTAPSISTTEKSMDDLAAIDKEEPYTKKLCRDGYHRNAAGRCRKTLRRRLSFLPLAMKLAPSRSQVPVSRQDS